jgi:hypothetical protein
MIPGETPGKAIFLEQNEMCRVRDQHAAFRQCMHEIAHQSFEIPLIIG